MPTGGAKGHGKESLIPMPIIDIPFNRIALDIVGPLPKTSRGHRYILVIVDYATQYPEPPPYLWRRVEAVPLRATASKGGDGQGNFNRPRVLFHVPCY